VCNGCYNKAICGLEYEPGVVTYKYFNKHYRQGPSDLAKVLLGHPLIKDNQGVPGCPHEPLLNAIVNNAPEVALRGTAQGEAYCLWSMDASYREGSDEDQLMGLQLLCFDKGLGQAQRKGTTAAADSGATIVCE
jgi:hypothetical protein